MKKFLLTLFLIPTIILTWCSINTDNPINVNPLGNATDINPIKNPINIDVLKTLTLEDAVNKFWQPYKRDSFKMEDWLTEFRIWLYNFFTAEKYQNTDIQIQEYTWDKDMVSMVTVRYYQKDNVWTLIDILQRDKWSVF
jgi:hypothetical protein